MRRPTRLDFVGSAQLTDKLQFVLNTDGFSQHSATLGPAYADGFAAYLNYAVNQRWKASVRGEWLKTRHLTLNTPADGKATLSEVTVTLGYSPVHSVTLLGELRYDLGDRIYPDPGPPFRSTQGNVAFEAIYSF